MNRKRSAARPALILLNDVQDIPLINYIDGPEYLIGRSPEANLTILQQYISRKHCTFKYDAETDKWSICSHSRKAVSVRGIDVKAEESFIMECGDKIKISPLLVFEFKCSPNADMKCCLDFKRIKLIDDEEINDEKTAISTVPITDVSPITTTNNTPELPATLPISQLPDSSDFNDDFEATEMLSKTDSEPLFNYDVESMPSCDSVTNSSSPLSIDDLENAIQKYLNSLTTDLDSQYDDDDISWKRKLKDELTFRLEYLRKLDRFNSSCELNFSYSSSKDIHAIVQSLKLLSSFFKDEYSKLQFRSEQLLCGEQDRNLNRIIVNLDALLMNKTTSVMQYVHKFFDTSLNTKIPDSCDKMDTSTDVHAIEKSSDGCNVRTNEELEAEVEKYKELNTKLELEVEKFKENMSWYETRIKFLEMKVKEKEKVDIELETVKEDYEMMESQLAELKRTLANMEIMELEYKCLLETTKHREEDKRSKDALDRTINTLNNQVKELKEENAQLLSDKCAIQDENTKLKQECTELKEKLNDKIVMASSTNASAGCFSGNSSDGEYCCDMVKEIKASLIDLMEREFQCSICGEMLIESTVTNCNHVFCNFCLQEWKKKQKKCPFCRAQLVKEVKASIVDEYITGLLKLISDKMYSDRMKVISDRTTKKTPVAQTKGKNTRRSRQATTIVDLS